MTKYTATATVTFQVEFDDDEDLNLNDQAFEAAADRFGRDFLDLEVCEVAPSAKTEVAA
ncbi:hypothetical protein [Sinorhizobium meliloti]|uniref:hypothetical protein n=1 Tax=Rhizobium meliloti TaxID=382 RepID=UPI0013E2D4C1|nr:hypothetical protein [Sinorhizobium meliloti]